MDIKIAPSILSADFGKLAEEIRSVERAGADCLHVDVMDGNFVPNISIGPVVVKYIRKNTRLPFDSHLMISRPLEYIDAFIEAGSDSITVHSETVSIADLKKLAGYLHKKDIGLGISLNPATPFKRIEPALEIVDTVLVMSVNPGFGGQKFMPEVLGKIAMIRAAFNKDIAVDGGINAATASLAVRKGANVLVAGSFVFEGRDRKKRIASLRKAARSAHTSWKR